VVLLARLCRKRAHQRGARHEPEVLQLGAQTPATLAVAGHRLVQLRLRDRALVAQQRSNA